MRENTSHYSWFLFFLSHSLSSSTSNSFPLPFSLFSVSSSLSLSLSLFSVSSSLFFSLSHSLSSLSLFILFFMVFSLFRNNLVNSLSLSSVGGNLISNLPSPRSNCKILKELGQLTTFHKRRRKRKRKKGRNGLKYLSTHDLESWNYRIDNLVI